MTRDSSTVPDALIPALEATVPLYIAVLATVPYEQRARYAQEDTQTIASHGDDLMFGGKHCAAAFDALARGLAVGALQPGGVTFLGVHWEAQPEPEPPLPPDPGPGPGERDTATAHVPGGVL